MSASYLNGLLPARFEREMGCMAAEWVSWLPRAVGEHPLQIGHADAAMATGQAMVRLGDGELVIHWHALPPRRLGLAVLPRLHVAFSFLDVPDAERQRFMKRFDLYTQRGGG